ncbi:MAG TPA: glycosyltransferase family 4 protein [Mycobacteriales bacterium]|nr:glycosyltransferase family 4 protein [Mycobacteriales bacterium]
MRTLCVTNDFPPRPGGIQQFVHALAARLPPEEIVVYAPAWQRAREFDAEQRFPVVRHPGSLMLPVPGVLRRARAVARAEGCDTVWFGAAAPLGLLAGPLGDVVGRAVASTHGHEIGWARLPVARQMLRRVARDVDVMTYLGDFTGSRLTAAVGGLTTLEPLPSGVDVDVFHPGVPGDDVRRTHGLVDRPVVVCVSRVVPRKGQDVLIRAWPQIRRAVPGAALLIVGGGPYLPRLRRLAGSVGVDADIRFTGAVPWADLPAHYAAGDVFAMPCRSRLRGLDVEGLGIVYLEAAAVGLPVVAGRSGGAPEAVVDGTTGLVVDGESVSAVATAVIDLLGDPERARAMGRAGRDWVERAWGWDLLAARLRTTLAAGRTGQA